MGKEYRGRLETDGNGNLLVSDRVVNEKTGEEVLGPDHGLPVFHNTESGKYEFVEPGSPSHNELHHEKFVTLQATQDQDSDLPGFAGTKEKPVEGHEHHWGAVEKVAGVPDDHFSKGAPRDTKIKILPDRIAAVTTGHTDAYRG